MKFVALPEKKENGNQNVIKITNTVIDEENPTKFEIEGERFVYPQAESDEEMYQLCGGQANLLKVFNEHLRDEAVNAGKSKIRTATTGTTDEIINAGLNECKSFNFIESTKITASEAKSKLSNLMALKDSGLSEEELADRVLRELGLK